MLLGCCHCEEESSSNSSSEPSESSSSSEEPSSEASSSRELINCLACLAIPVRWRITGIDRSKVTYVHSVSLLSLDCAATFEDGLVCDIASMATTPPNSGGVCVRYESQARLVNHSQKWIDNGPPVTNGDWSPSCQLSNHPQDARVVINMRRVGVFPGNTIRIQVILQWGYSTRNPQGSNRYTVNSAIWWGGPAGQDFILTGRNCLRDFVVNGPADTTSPNGFYTVTTPGNSGPVTLSPA